ncbi:hypothetical protein JOM56_004684 [Amanita muscaria]
MPRTTLSAVQAELLDFSETLLVAADLLSDNTDVLDDLPELISVEDLDNDNFTHGDGAGKLGGWTAMTLESDIEYAETILTLSPSHPAFHRFAGDVLRSLGHH